MGLLLLYLFIALFFSFLCSIMEATLLSTPNSYLLVKSNQGHHWAKSFLRLKKNIDKPLSAILALNTVAHTIGAAGVGAQAVKVFGEAYFGLISAILTVLILVITEIIPKTIGARYNKRLARYTNQIIRLMIYATYPLVVLSSFITKAISRKGKEQTISREEISALAELGAAEGLFSDTEFGMLQNLLRLKSVKVDEVMTPRVVVEVADENMSLSEFKETKSDKHFSRIPVFDQKEENITGYVLRKDIFEYISDNKAEVKLFHLKRKITVVPVSIPLLTVWDKLLKQKEHIALVVDEYGGMSGVITMEDIIETMLGLEIIDENDEVTDMRRYAKERWLKKYVQKE